MTLDETMKLLAAKGSEQTRKTFRRHGAPETMFGVKVGDLKPIAKLIKGNQTLAMELYATGNSDAMYLAGMVTDGSKMKRTDLERWAKTAPWHMISGCTVPWVAAEHPDAIAIALKWIDSPKHLVAISGWNTLAALVTTMPDEKLPTKTLSTLLDRIVKTIKTSQSRVRYAMNGFIISCGTYSAPLADKAIAAARKVGRVEVDMGNTECQVPDAEAYIVKSRRGQPIAPKRKTTRC